MAGRGRRVRFHGAFASKAKARRKEAARPGAYIKSFRLRGQTRYAVITRGR